MAKNLLQNVCDLVPVTPVAATAQVSSPFGLVKIKSQSAVALTTTTGFTVTDLAQYPYTSFRLITSITSFTGSAYIFIQVSSNNGSSYITTTSYASNLARLGPGATAFTSIISGGTAQAGIFIQDPADYVLGNPLVSITDLFNFNTASSFPTAITNAHAFNNSTTPFYIWGNGTYATSINANAFRVVTNLATATGNFTLYGYN